MGTKFIDKHEEIHSNQIQAIILFISLLIVTCFIILPRVSEAVTQNNEINQTRFFHILFFYNFNGMVGYFAHPDIEIDLLVRYPHGTLIVDDPVKISGKATMYTPITQNITSLTVNFQNAQRYERSQNENGVARGVDLYLDKTANKSELVGNATMVWRLEGSYYPQLIITSWNGTHLIAQAAKSDDVAITVYPKSQLAQIVTNKISTDLAISAYFLGFLGTLILIIDLWRRK